jgi:hypothetical protein
MSKAKSSENDHKDAELPRMDDVLKRMLSTPPDPKRKAKPAVKTAQKKPAK